MQMPSSNIIHLGILVMSFPVVYLSDTVTYEIHCGGDHHLTAKFDVSTSDNATSTMYSVTMCHPSFSNHYCNHDNSAWRVCPCKHRLDSRGHFRIKCYLSEKKEIDYASWFLQTFRLKIVVVGTSKGKVVMKIPITPAMRCSRKVD